MRQVLLELGPVKIYGYGLMLFLGFVCCTWWATRRAQREGINPDDVFDIALWAFIGGLVGARVFFAIQKGLIEKTGQIQTFWDLFAIWKGGLVYYGGVIGGVAGVLWLVRRRRWRLWRYMDLIMPPVALGLAFGRMGCFLNGCCFGDYCQLPWAIRFPVGSIPYDSQLWGGWIHQGAPMLLVHPTQLYSLLNAVLLAALAAAYYRIRRRDGETTALVLVVYPITRFLLELVRNDEGAIWVTGLTISQNVSVLAFVFGAVLWWRVCQRPVQYGSESRQQGARDTAK